MNSASQRTHHGVEIYLPPAMEDNQGPHLPDFRKMRAFIVNGTLSCATGPAC